MESKLKFPTNSFLNVDSMIKQIREAGQTESIDILSLQWLTKDSRKFGFKESI
jgi:hypothetical protein